MIAETRTSLLIDAFRRRFTDPHAGVTYEIPQYIDHSWRLANGIPLEMKGTNGELELALHLSAHDINLNNIHEGLHFRVTDPKLKPGIYVDMATEVINIPADEHRNPNMLYHLMNGIARFSYYKKNTQAVETYANVLQYNLQTYSPELPIPFSNHPMIRRQQLEVWRDLCNQEIDISQDTLQLIKAYGLMIPCGLESLDDLMLTVNSDSTNRSLFQIPINLEQVYEETGWNMGIPQQMLETYLYIR